MGRRLFIPTGIFLLILAYQSVRAQGQSADVNSPQTTAAASEPAAAPLPPVSPLDDASLQPALETPGQAQNKGVTKKGARQSSAPRDEDVIQAQGTTDSSATGTASAA